MEIEFSVIIPVYNVEDYLLNSVDSVLEQEYNSLEIILVDDGSTDSSGKLCDKLEDDHECITVIHQDNQGLSAARNSGMKVASGRYIILLDSDDKLSENGLIHLHNIIIKYDKPDFIISRRGTIVGNDFVAECEYVFPKDKLKGMNLPEVYNEIQSYPDMWMGAWIFTISKEYMYSKDLFFYPGLLHEDEEWVPRVFFGGGIIAYNNSLLYINRPDRTGSITTVPNIKRLFDKLFIVDRLAQIFTSVVYADDVLDSIERRRTAIVFGVIVELGKYHRFDRFDELVNIIKRNIGLLKKSKRKLYKVVFISVKTIGVYRTSVLLGKFQK